MRDFAILWPSIALAALTFVVWATILVRRGMYLHGKDLESMAVRDDRPAVPAAVSAPNDNLLNLCELPVLFHLLCIMLAVTGLISPALLTAAWAFVALRVVHSLIHCTYNKVLHRFFAYLLSTLVLIAMWAAFALSLSAAA